MRNFKKYLAAALVAAMAMPVVLPAMADDEVVTPAPADETPAPADETPAPAEKSAKEKAEDAIKDMTDKLGAPEWNDKKADKDAAGKILDKAKEYFEAEGYTGVMREYAKFNSLLTNRKSFDKKIGDERIDFTNFKQEFLAKLQYNINKTFIELEKLAKNNSLDDAAYGKIEDLRFRFAVLVERVMEKDADIEGCVREYRNLIKELNKVLTVNGEMNFVVDEMGNLSPRVKDATPKAAQADLTSDEARKLAETGVDFSAIAGVMSLASVAGLGGLAIKRRK